MTLKSRIDFSNYFSKGSIDRGERYYAMGAVQGCAIEKLDDGTFEITSLVLGSRNAPYEVCISADIEGGEIFEIDGECSCPVGFQCKHVVATLLKAASILEDRVQTTPTTQPKSGNWEEWFSGFKVAAEEAAKPKERIVYVIEETNYGPKKTLVIRIEKSGILKDGGFGKFQSTNPDSVSWTRNAAPIDAELLLKMKKANLNSYGSFYLKQSNSGYILRRLLETDRAFFGEFKESPLKIAEPRYLKLSWQLLNDGRQYLKSEIEGGGQILPVSPPWYFDAHQNECGPLISNLELDSLSPLLQAPPIAPTEVREFKEALKKNNLSLPAPKTYTIIAKKINPKLHLDLFGARDVNPYEWGEPKMHPLITPSFLYEDTKVSTSQEDPVLYESAGEDLVEIPRCFAAEKKLLETFKKENVINPLEQGYPYRYIEEKYRGDFTIGYGDWKEEYKASAFMNALPIWKKNGWSITIDDSFPYQCIEEESEWYFDIDEGSQMQWFDLELGIEVDGEKINLLPFIVSLIKKSPEILSPEFIEEVGEDFQVAAQLSDGRYLQLPLKKIKGILSTLCELSDPDSLEGGKLTLPRLRAGDLLKTTQALDIDWEGGGNLKHFAEKLQNFKGISPVTPPTEFKAQLRPYQQEGLNWLQFLSEHELGGILADDMGLGKTVQTLAHICAEKKKLKAKIPSLVVAPTSLMTNWMQESKKFAPNLKTLTLYGPDRKSHFKSIPEFDVVFTTYPLLSRDHEHLCEHDYHTLILDEAQAIKNPRSKSAKICHAIKANHRICLTGTPMENHLEELWSLFNFANPGLLGNSKQFKRIFRTPIEKHGSTSMQKKLADRVAPFMVRRTKEKVAKELPQKTEIIQTVEIEGDQRNLYEAIRLAMQKKVSQALKSKGFASSQIIILDALLKLRQVCCDPRLIKLNSAKDVKLSAKLTFLKGMLSDLLEEGRKILLFSSFTSMLALIEEHLKETGVSYSKLTGQTKDRETAIRSFQEGDNPIFLISLKAGGTGLNLTAADTVIHYDPWWNPAAENQATDRAHRIGQTKPIFVYKLITKDTVEEKILKMQEKKQALMDGLFDQKQKKHSSLTPEDLEYLLEPLS
ncbi:DEAD/DEAH box helicase [Candidatus Neptunochlamydia vexilliferae]|uniref:Helicase n=1 Tax=Candidatus Neptunichlamydia vexilliferae TaxID=1651774 RepID=A0ABS0AZT3_9BACT|nr:DEAD/DEAH box helicase [Candidatus Neptunochlamydia vexilliferae]MBF5059622.1 hypothetical protein [Candidatus Neptunochlamydia vexilliferae]